MIPIRGDVHVAVDHEHKDPQAMTLRQCVEYYKKIVRVGTAMGTITNMEDKHINQAWGYLVGVVATRESVPSGWLMMMLAELARSEMRALDLAKDANGNPT